MLAVDTVRYQGEPIALVGADHPETARRAIKLIKVDYDVHANRSPTPKPPSPARARPCTPAATSSGTSPSARATADATADVVVTGEYEVGMQDQAFLGPESGLAVPAEDGSIDLYVATQWLHVDQRQVAEALGLPLEKVRLTLAGVGGAFGGREDLSMQVHACLLALHVGKPVKMVYNREESFFGHVHRHPAKMYYEHGATRDGQTRLPQGQASTSTAAPTPPAPARSSPTRPPSARARTTSRT